MTSLQDVGRTGGQAVRIISMNTGGLNAAIKRTKVITHIKNLNADVMFLQETHLQKSDHKKLNRLWLGQIFHSQFNCKTRGTAILIRKNVHFASTNTITDPEGRYTIAVGTLYQKPVIFASVYAPNWDDHNFFNSLFSLIPSLNTHTLILGGDMNCVIDPTLDRSSSRAIPPSKMSQTLRTLMDQFGYIDPWRFLNASSRQYSFFSHAHRSFSRIDYFVVDKNIISSLISVQYSPITVSDHSTVILDLWFDSKPKQFRSWRLDPLLLSDEAFCKVISDEITFFCDTNKNNETSPSLLWETLKAFIRGKIISYTSHLNKKRRKRKEYLEKSIADLDSSLAITNTPDL